ncbi:MAG: hypothetical protein IJ819_00255 [Clostridiales bacterium]|nr:hypothetical protein [Clostridiales bacterium]
MVYRYNDQSIGVGNLPNCKKKCLYIGHGCCIRKVATFSNDEEAENFERTLQYFLGLEDRDIPKRGKGET